ncbi:DNA/RNA non-specific endonuclease [Saprolegnia parasitica CBS 223.65]|uniref:DNA/RNA non-specific endonuclease n=1 Tax=Saprolegnia parasitica (strain CBS 223.65) TaxID=695850 RepID=A0A067CJ51_SAPPC|nr:DNA/RNA non-specific endonuclease [Saprolegnia parasitica CBS 223.65]KDO26837.1 DNA/RNA non-specific endonuclease [Saprolegnia parasitica CBS 223.65]|eukprot:XP_012202483.1 DNA/RNA non-specific endonuclease [Saprolegnia parasitica CBS 223.65]
MRTAFACLALATAAAASANDKTLDYTGYQLSYDCASGAADRWTYSLDVDNGSAKRPSGFYDDPNLPTNCKQQKSTKAYGNGYDRGHLVASNLMDTDEEMIHEAHYMTNILPQISSFNQGIWAKTEALEDCYRDLHPITTYGGVVFTDASNDIFVDKWGVKTPDFWWKVVLTKDDAGNDKIISWYFPNKANLGKLDEYLTSVSAIEKKLNDGLGPIPVPLKLKAYVAPSSWALPSNCDRS